MDLLNDYFMLKRLKKFVVGFTQIQGKKKLKSVLITL